MYCSTLLWASNTLLTCGCEAHAESPATTAARTASDRSRDVRTGLVVMCVAILAWQTLRWNAERQGDLAQLRLDDASVPRTHAQQLLLRRRQPLVAWIGEGVSNSSVRLQTHCTAANRRLEQRHDGSFERAVERRVRLSEVAVCFLDARLERGVQRRAALRVDRGDGLGERVVPVVTALVHV